MDDDITRVIEVSMEKGSIGKDKSHAQFVWLYLTVYLICTAADWLQGPYVYALYESYGYTKDENAILFVVGFGSSAVFGVFAGLIADRLGRRTACVLYCILYILSCATKHFNVYWILMLGRLFGGAATSLLFSSFDSWLVSEHETRNYNSTLLSTAFSSAVFYNSIVAIACGFIGEFGTSRIHQTQIFSPMNMYVGGYLVPFDLSLLLCGIAAFLMWKLWPENYGAVDESRTDGVIESLRIVIQNPSVASIGFVTAFYEASMYIFIFNWTPVVTPVDGEKPPYGLIFAMFMVCTMAGSQLCDYMRMSMSAHKVATITLLTASLSHATLVLDGGLYLNLAAFLVFETSVGMYFPSVGTVKAEVVPDSHRATIYNIFRIPLNIVVVAALCFHFSILTSFAITTACLICGFLCMASLSCRLEKRVVTTERVPDDEHTTMIQRSSRTVEGCPIGQETYLRAEQ